MSILKNSIKCYTTKKYPLISAYPNNIMIEITNACNLKCTMCYHKKMKRKIGFMTKELYRKIINEAADIGIENVGLYTTGEAFLHPDIFEFIKIAKKKGIKYVYITTNGMALNKDKVKKIISSGLDSIKFSIDAASKKEYEKLKIGANWSKLLDNIKYLRELRDKKNSKLKIFASFLITDDNKKDLPEYNRISKNLIDETLFSFMNTQAGQSDINIKQKKSAKLFPCGLLWNRFIINYDGKLTICCIDFEAKLIYGDINKNTLKECWNNEIMQKFRKIHKEKNFKVLPLCSKCNLIKDDISKNMKIARYIKRFGTV